MTLLKDVPLDFITVTYEMIDYLSKSITTRSRIYLCDLDRPHVLLLPGSDPRQV